MKFSFAHLFVKFTSRLFWAYLLTTFITYSLLYKDGDHAWFLPMIVVWGVVTVLYIGGNVLIDALGKMIEKASLNINAGLPSGNNLLPAKREEILQ